MRRRLLPIAALSGCLLLPAAGSAAPGLELAVQDDAVLLYRSYGDFDLALDRAQEMHATAIRANLRWAGSMPAAQAHRRQAPASVQWDFSHLQRLLEGAAVRGIAVQVTLTGPAPAWATANGRLGVNRPNPKLFARFVTAAVRALDRRVARYSIWNEPNWNSQLGPHRQAAAVYRGLYRRGYRAIKREQPDAEVLIGELMPGANRTHSTPALKFLRAVVCPRCPNLLADGFALHPYNFARRPSSARSSDPDVVEMGSLSRLTRQLDRLRASGALRTPGGARMPVYLTEFGYHTTGPLAVTASRQAKWLTEAWGIAKRNPRVKQLLQYMLVDPWPKKVTWRSAVLRRDGTPTAAFYALRKLASGE